MDEDEEVRDNTGEALTSQHKWPDIVWEKIHNILDKILVANKTVSDDYVSKALASHVFGALTSRSSWPDSVWQRIEIILNSNDAESQEFALEALAGQVHWPEAVWQNVAEIFMKDWKRSHGLTRVMAAILSALENKPVWPDAVWKALPESIGQYGITHFFDSALASQSAWPRDVWRHILTIMNNRMFDPMTIMEAIRRMTTVPREFVDAYPDVKLHPNTRIVPLSELKSGRESQKRLG